VRNLGEPALGFVDESMRLYPNRELAAHVVGFEGMDGKGLAGVEQAWDVHLAGTEGRALVGRDALGREITGAPKVIKPSTAGQGVMLTLDATLQYIAEKEVDAAWRRTRSKAALALAMDPRTARSWRWRSARRSTRTASAPPPTTSAATAASPTPSSPARRSR
jgi:cell division protein FtsI (penicillin-binding protein 3)